jgi:hypothetical protein
MFNKFIRYHHKYSRIKICITHPFRGTATKLPITAINTLLDNYFPNLNSKFTEEKLTNKSCNNPTLEETNITDPFSGESSKIPKSALNSVVNNYFPNLSK